MPEETTSKSPDQVPQKVDQAPQKVSEDVAAEESETIPNPAAGESKTPSAAEEHAPSTDEPQATDLPTGGGTATEPTKDNSAVNPDAAQEKDSGTASGTDTTPQPAATESEDKDKPAEKAAKQDQEAKPSESDKPAAKPAAKEESTADSVEDKKKQKSAAKAAAAKQAKADDDESDGKPAGKAGAKKSKKDAKPAVEDKPFAEFIQQDFLPTLEKSAAGRGLQDLQLTFENSQVMGRWHKGQRQFQFTIYFPEADIQGRKAFSWAEGGTTSSTLEPFLSDERRVTLDLLVFYVLQRLNAQKWLGGN